MGGLDMIMPGVISFGNNHTYPGQNLTNAVREHRIPEQRVSDMATRIAAVRYKLLLGQNNSIAIFNRQFMGSMQNSPKTILNSSKPKSVRPTEIRKYRHLLIRSMGTVSADLLRNYDGI